MQGLNENSFQYFLKVDFFFYETVFTVSCKLVM